MNSASRFAIDHVMSRITMCCDVGHKLIVDRTMRSKGRHFCVYIVVRWFVNGVSIQRQLCFLIRAVNDSCDS